MSVRKENILFSVEREDLSDNEKLDMFYDEEESAIDYAKKWMMISSV